MIGKTLAHYEITSQIGKGGMGEVYQAKDQKLGRDVAIKVLPEEFAQDADRVARFQREAKLLASLNHPNIAAIYGLEESDGTHFLVMELIGGQTLADRIKAGAIPVEEALKLALQIAEAFEAAHEKGVIHRDLKPANIKVTPDGKVKVLDFGLAKAFAGEQANLNLSNSPTLSQAATMQGVILGTAAYMSPEQAKGKEVDKRADVWAFGVVLFEMLTGKSLFSGEDISSTLARVLERQPDFSTLPINLHPKIIEMLERCLEKDPRDRYGSINDARVDIQKVLADPSGVFVRPVTIGKSRNRLRTILPWVAVTLILIIIAGWILLTTRDGKVIRLSVTFPDYLRVASCLPSPDGRTMVIRGRPRNPENPEDDIVRLYTRQMDSSDWRLVPGSENDANGFAFSPDSRWLAILARVDPSSNDRRLWKVPLEGNSPPQNLANWADDWYTPFLWLPDGDLIVITENKEIVRIPTDKSPPRAPIPIRPDGFTDEVVNISASGGSILPDGRHILGWVSRWSEQGYRKDIVVLDVVTGDARTVHKDAGPPIWSPTGHLLFSRADTILAIPFDPADLVTTGTEVPITDGLYVSEVWNSGWFDLTQSGVLIHRTGGLVGQSRKLVWWEGDTLEETGLWSDDPRPFEGYLRISRDGSYLAVQIPDSYGIFDCWLSELERPGLRRFHEAGWDCTPGMFSPDSQEFLYTLYAQPTRKLYKRRVDGIGEPVLLLEDSSITDYHNLNSFTPDGKHLILTHVLGGGRVDLVLLPLEAGADGSRTPSMLMPDARSGRPSPDGNLLLYRSEVSGQWEWYVCTIDWDGSFGSPLKLTTDGGTMDWQLFRFNDNWNLIHRYKGSVYRVTVTADPELRIVEREMVGEWNDDVIGYGSMPDGRLLVLKKGDDEINEFTSMTVILNWTTELRQRLAASGK